jgi:hypothetical protein
MRSIDFLFLSSLVTRILFAITLANQFQASPKAGSFRGIVCHFRDQMIFCCFDCFFSQSKNNSPRNKPRTAIAMRKPNVAFLLQIRGRDLHTFQRFHQAGSPKRRRLFQVSLKGKPFFHRAYQHAR